MPRFMGSVLGTFAVVSMSTMVSLLLTVAVANDHAPHRLANMENDAGGARGYERNREQQR